METKTSRTTRLLMSIIFTLWVCSSIPPAEKMLSHGELSLPWALLWFFLTACLVICYITLRRLLTIVSIADNRITSFLFGKKRCEVTLAKSVYYVVMTSKRGHSGGYIVLSNTPFVYSTHCSALYNPFYRGASLKHRIILPYTAEIKRQLPTQQWINMDTYDWEQYTALYNALPFLYRRFSEWLSCPRKTIGLYSIFALECLLMLIVLFRMPQGKMGTVIVCFALFMLSLLVYNLIQINKPHLYLWLHISRRLVRSTTINFSASRYRPSSEETRAEISLEAPVYYAKIRISNINLHAANYILLSNKELPLQRAKIRHYASEHLDLSQIIPVIYCKHTAKRLDLTQFILVE